MAHQYSQVGFDSSVEVNEVNLSLYYGGTEKYIAPDNDMSMMKLKLKLGSLLYYTVFLKGILQDLLTRSALNFQKIKINK